MRKARGHVMSTNRASIKDGLQLVHPLHVSRSKRVKATVVTQAQVEKVARKLAKERKIAKARALELVVAEFTKRKIVIVGVLKKPVAAPKTRERKIKRAVAEPAAAPRDSGLYNPSAVCWKRQPGSKFYGL